eukprot:878211-Prymnesium_polylepis.1
MHRRSYDPSYRTYSTSHSLCAAIHWSSAASSRSRSSLSTRLLIAGANALVSLSFKPSLDCAPLCVNSPPTRVPSAATYWSESYNLVCRNRPE